MTFKPAMLSLVFIGIWQNWDWQNKRTFRFGLLIQELQNQREKKIETLLRLCTTTLRVQRRKRKRNYYFKTRTSDPFIYTPPRSTTINKAKTIHMHEARDVVHILPRISSPSKRLHKVLNSWKHRLSPPASKWDRAIRIKKTKELQRKKEKRAGSALAIPPPISQDKEEEEPQEKQEKREARGESERRRKKQSRRPPASSKWDRASQKGNKRTPMEKYAGSALSIPRAISQPTKTTRQRKARREREENGTPGSKWDGTSRKENRGLEPKNAPDPHAQLPDRFHNTRWRGRRRTATEIREDAERDKRERQREQQQSKRALQRSRADLESVNSSNGQLYAKKVHNSNALESASYILTLNSAISSR